MVFLVIQEVQIKSAMGRDLFGTFFRKSISSKAESGRGKRKKGRRTSK
jgi:hypothetical protein